MVPLKEAWGSGARLWSADNRRRHANDLGFSASLLLRLPDGDPRQHQPIQGDRDSVEWLPPCGAARCTYAIQWVQVKYRWRLGIDSAERSRLTTILSGTAGPAAPQCRPALPDSHLMRV